MDNIFDEIKQERLRQDNEWGEQRHDPFVWLAILGEEVGEANKALLDNFWEDEDMEEYRKELIQIAAVAIAAIESFDEVDTDDDDVPYTDSWDELSDDEINLITGK